MNKNKPEKLEISWNEANLITNIFTLSHMAFHVAESDEKEICKESPKSLLELYEEDVGWVEIKYNRFGDIVNYLYDRANSCAKLYDKKIITVPEFNEVTDEDMIPDARKNLLKSLEEIHTYYNDNFDWVMFTLPDSETDEVSNYLHNLDIELNHPRGLVFPVTNKEKNFSVYHVNSIFQPALISSYWPGFLGIILDKKISTGYPLPDNVKDAKSALQWVIDDVEKSAREHHRQEYTVEMLEELRKEYFDK